jgi:hypothetical protein
VPTGGGSGGGAISITTPLLTINGILSANGGVGGSNGCSYGGGGGGGGSLKIQTASLKGSGAINANGGAGGGGGCGFPTGGNGGGGNVSVNADKPFLGTISIIGHAPSQITYGNYTAVFAGGGDSICDSGSLSSTCVISSQKPLPPNYLITGTGSLTVTAGGSIFSPSTNSNPQLSIALGGDILVQNLGSITSNFTAFTATNVTIDAGGSINANGLGFGGGPRITNGSGPSPGQIGVGFSGGGGGGHLSVGMNSPTGNLGGAAPYDIAAAPTQFGSGGGGGNYAGGSGGGAIKINITGTLTLNGTLSANGSSGSTDFCSTAGGGGAGGSLWIIAANLLGTGTFAANGGAGGGGGCGYSPAAYGGGGILSLQVDKPFSGSVSLAGRHPYQLSEGNFTSTFSAGADSICDLGSLGGICTINSNKALPPNYSIAGAGNLTVASGGLLYVPTNSSSSAVSLAIGGSVLVQNLGIISADLATFSATNVTIDAGGSINANGLGFGGGAPGNGGAGPSPGEVAHVGVSGGGGGGHLSVGMNSSTGNLGGAAPYDIAITPTQFGSGGGAGKSYAGGSGGGAIKMNITGTLTLNGTLSANGSSGSTDFCSTAGGGGAGGSLWLIATNLLGTGTIAANGGAGGGGGCGFPPGAYGGGGILMLQVDKPFSGAINLNGYFTTMASYGNFSSTFSAGADSICDAGSLAGVCVVSTLKALPPGYTVNGVGGLTMAAGGLLYNPTTSSDPTLAFSIGTNVVILNGGGILANISAFTASNLDINAGGSMIANGLGSAGADYGNPGSGIGKGLPRSDCCSGGSGAGHGGIGGLTPGAAGGGTYGNPASPVEYGSGGGGGSSGGGSGGGAIALNLTGTLTLNGTISTNGSDGAIPNCQSAGGGGSGGSIWIVTNAITGAGVISSNGGGGSPGGCGYGVGGGGAGGDLKVTSTVNTFVGTKNVNGGAGANVGGVGSNL